MVPRLRLFKNGKLNAPLEDLNYPWENPYEIPSSIKTKDEYRAYHSENKDTICPHFSIFEGLSSTQVINGTNRPYLVNAMVADYDSKMLDEPRFLSGRAHLLASKYAPYAINRTFSGGVRVVWVFEKPIFYYDDEHWKLFSMDMKKLLRMEEIWPGLDPKSFVVTQTFVCGNKWEIPGHVLPHDVPMSVCFAIDQRHSNYGVSSLDEFPIPYEEIDARFQELKAEGAFAQPDQVPSRIDIGTRSVRFWDKSADHPKGACFRKHGVKCFTGPEPWLPWDRLLGREWVDKYRQEAIKAVMDEVWVLTDGGGGYVLRTKMANWVKADKSDVREHLKLRGMSDLVPKGASQSPLAKFMASLKIDDAKHVVAMAPFVHTSKRVVDLDGYRYLNTARTTFLRPADHDGEFPWIMKYLETLFPSQQTREHLLAWLKVWYKGNYDEQPTKGHTIFIGGPPETGKTFFTTRFLSDIFGGHRLATANAIGEKNFNSKMFEAALWCIEDSEALTSGSREHKKFTNWVKNTAVNRTMQSDAKHGFNGDLPFFGRASITLNLDPASLSVLPDLTASVHDKVNLYKTGKEVMIPCDLAQYQRELPYFLRWLLTMPIAPWIRANGRMGIASYADPYMETEALLNSPRHSFMEALEMMLRSHYESQKADVAFKYKEWERVYTMTELIKELNDTRTLSPGKIPSVNVAGKTVKQLKSMKPNLYQWIEVVNNGSKTQYKIIGKHLEHK